MSNNRYLEIDSTHRNRNEWPLAGEFAVPISQSGRKNQQDALDPVCLSAPIVSWTSNNLDKGGAVSLTGDLPYAAATPINYVTDPLTVIIQSNIGTMQQADNYYTGLVLQIDPNPSAPDPPSPIYRRITGFKYLSTNGDDYGLVTLDSGFSDIVVLADATYTITDFTDFNDKTNPNIFVPSGNLQIDAYANTILYNETRLQYRPIRFYDGPTTHGMILTTETSPVATNISGPIPTGWTVNDNFSIRKEIPFLPRLGSAAYPTVTAATINTITISIPGLGIPITGVDDLTGDNINTNFFKNYGIRILPNPTDAAGAPPAPVTRYDYKLTPPLNECRVIGNSVYNFVTGVLVITTVNGFTIDPTATIVVNSPLTSIGVIEILTFSYDNFNPFTYTGSLVSQQEMVCYEIELLNVVLPNQVLLAGRGGRIAFYPYVYIELSNVSSAGSGLRNVIYSNNPNSSTVTFRAPIDDIQNPQTSTFIKIDGNGMVQTIKFKPNDNLFFRVTLSTGEIYNTINQETVNPFKPNELAQISALFSLRRL
jgi:hypothetical protein